VPLRFLYGKKLLGIDGKIAQLGAKVARFFWIPSLPGLLSLTATSGDILEILFPLFSARRWGATAVSRSPRELIVETEQICWGHPLLWDGMLLWLLVDCWPRLRGGSEMSGYHAHG
jgi:hypothetical protein